MNLKLRMALAAVVVALVSGIAVAALATITEQSTAGHGPGPNGGSNGIFSDHFDGPSKTDAWIAGADGPFFDQTNPNGSYWGELETQTAGVEVADYAWARDGNVVEATTQNPQDTYWEVKTAWRLRGIVTTDAYWGPDNDTGYSMFLRLEAETHDDTGNWSDLNDFEQDERMIVQETQFGSPFEVFLHVEKDTEDFDPNPDEVKFRYAVDMTAIGSITRSDGMKIRVRGRVQGARDPGAPLNAGIIRLIDSGTDTVLDEEEFF